MAPATTKRTSYFVLRTSPGVLALLLGWRLLTLLFAAVAARLGGLLPAPASFGELLLRTLDHWDAGWYVAIARDGYTVGGNGQQANVAFYPLLPALIHLAHFVAPSWRLAGALVVHAALLGAVLYLHALVRLDYDQPTALRAVGLLLIFPTAVFLTAIYTESLLLLTMTAAVYHARRGQWWAAGLWGLAAGLTKMVGGAVFVPLLWEYWRGRSWRGVSRRRLAGQLAALALVPLGALAFLAYLQLRFGSYRVYFAAQTGWYRGSWFQPFFPDGWRFLTAFLHGRGSQVVNYFYPQGNVTLPSQGAFELIDLLFLLVGVVVGVLLYLRVRASYGLFVLTVLGIAAWSGSTQSINRFALILFPLPIAFALAARRPLLGFALLTLSGFLFIFFSYLFVNGYWAG
ncbi:MAG: mannosyltransferase family protein [Thermomicrobiales bacterium]|jgi:hypothetical protein